MVPAATAGGQVQMHGAAVCSAASLPGCGCLSCRPEPGRYARPGWHRLVW